MIGSGLCLYYTHALFSNSKIVIAVQVAAVALLLWGRKTLGRRSFHAAAVPTAGDLVTSGPYHFIRHPIYTAGCLFCWAGILGNVSMIALAAGALLLLGSGIRIFTEEKLLKEHYPQYGQYATATKRMIPFVF